ncbi:coiled-coil domain-containing protein 81-like isoform X3 [Mytilus galloprovincialis]|uniref:coiled-coil domain-containing protein 81-like isoform X3 n=1 Tax=Mytilus galloprovincialis TaxID=29158 RepID=UPI003F7C5895
MAEMQGIFADAKKNRFSSINALSDDDLTNVWENVSRFIESQMNQQKGVNIAALGTFTFSQKKLDIGNNKFIMMQRPIFMLSERFAQTHNLQSTKYHVPGNIPVVQLNFASMAHESPFDRDTVESCVKEILGSVNRAVNTKRNLELTFSGIGRLTIRDSKVKMRFYKEFINQMDGSGKMVDSMQNRPGTVDSVMSDRLPSRAGSSATVVLPKISNSNIANGGGLAPVTEQDEPQFNGEEQNGYEPQGESMFLRPPDLTEEGMEGLDIGDEATNAAIRHIQFRGEGLDEPLPGEYAPVNIAPPFETIDDESYLPAIDGHLKKAPVAPSRSGSRMAMPMAKATGVSLLDDLILSTQSPHSAPSPNNLARSSLNPLNDTHGVPNSLSPKLRPLERAQSADHVKFNVPTPPMSACGHPNAGQELCYLCHQRGRRNIPVSFNEERKRREEEEDTLLKQFQQMKDAEETLDEQENNLAKRHNLQKMAAFNLGVAEAVQNKKKTRETDFHKSYIFQRRPLTPPRIFKQEEYSKDLGQQVDQKEDTKKKRQADEDFLERLEQVQLAEDLAKQREQFLREKAEQQDMYKNALETQIFIRDLFRKPDGLLRSPEPPSMIVQEPKRLLTADIFATARRPIHSLSNISPFSLPMLPKVIRPFSEPDCSMVKPSPRRLRFKPVQVPPREPDHEVFGKHDMNNEKMAEKRRKAYDLFKEQQDLVAQKKREEILKRLQEQREEEDILQATKNELMGDRSYKYKRRFEKRKDLEGDWRSAAMSKKEKEMEDRLHALSPSLLLHEQCDKYSRCRQCKRKMKNCGESNIWSESRYIPGSRLMV